MRYFATIGGKERTIDVEHLGGSQYRVALDDGAAQTIDAQRVEGQVLSLLVGNRSFDADFDQDGDTLGVSLGGQSFQLELQDERRRRLSKAKAGFAHAGPVLIRAPMPGKVVKVLAEIGQEVAEGQGLVIIEAMKMENELRSPKAGKISAIHVREGQTVEGRADLISVD